MDRVRLGVAGCGPFAACHLETYRAVREAEVAAVFDIDRKKAEQLAAQFGVPKVCSSLAELCADPDLQAIDVVTAEQAHMEPAIAALCAGKHVFVEKPLATSLEHCSRILENAQSARRFVMAGHVLRFETRYAMLKAELSAGRLGRVVSMHSRRNRQKTHLAMCDRAHPALENSIHDVDIMLWYAGSPVTRVRGYGRRATGRKNPDTFWGVLEFESGAVGVVETIWMMPEEAGVLFDDAMEVVGTAGIGNIRMTPGGLTLLRETGYDAPDTHYGPALRDELAYFCACVMDHRGPEIITAVEGKRAVRVVLALIESAEQGRDIEIPEWD